jgi:hypothetical protein
MGGGSGQPVLKRKPLVLPISPSLVRLSGIMICKCRSILKVPAACHTVKLSVSWHILVQLHPAQQDDREMMSFILNEAGAALMFMTSPRHWLRQHSLGCCAFGAGLSRHMDITFGFADILPNLVNVSKLELASEVLHADTEIL